MKAKCKVCEEEVKTGESGLCIYCEDEMKQTQINERDFQVGDDDDGEIN